MSKKSIKSLKGTRMELIKKIQINKTKTPSSPGRLLEKRSVGVETSFRERKSYFSLGSRRSDRRFSSEQTKLFYAARATRGDRFIGVPTTLRGRDLFLLDLFFG